MSKIVLDHLYVTVSADEMKDLESLFSGLEGCEYKEVKAEGDSWTGLYISTSIRSYFEILRERRRGQFGIAVRSASPASDDIRKAMETKCSLPWLTGTRSFANGKPWFDWISLNEYLNTKREGLNLWGMYYYPHLFSNPTKSLPTSFAKLKSVTIEGDIRLREETIQLSQWLPEAWTHHHERSIMKLLDRDQSSVEIEFRWNDGIQGFNWLLAEFGTTQAQPVHSRMGKFFQFEQHDANLRVSRLKS